MDIEILKEIGLTENETQIYLTLIKEGESTANSVSEKTGLHRSYAYDTLSKLVNKGVVSYIVKSGKKYFKGVNPNKFLDILKEKEEKISNLIPDLLKMYKKEKLDYKVEILEGIEGTKTYYEIMLDDGINLRFREILFLGLKGQMGRESLKYYFPNLIKRAIRLVKKLVEEGHVLSLV